MENVQRERVEQLENQETVLVEEVREELEEMKGSVEIEKVFLTEKGAEVFRKTLAKKGFIEMRGFKELVLPFKEEIARRSWEVICVTSQNLP